MQLTQTRIQRNEQTNHVWNIRTVNFVTNLAHADRLNANLMPPRTNLTFFVVFPPSSHTIQTNNVFDIKQLQFYWQIFQQVDSNSGDFGTLESFIDKKVHVPVHFDRLIKKVISIQFIV